MILIKQMTGLSSIRIFAGIVYGSLDSTAMDIIRLNVCKSSRFKKYGKQDLPITPLPSTPSPP